MNPPRSRRSRRIVAGSSSATVTAASSPPASAAPTVRNWTGVATIRIPGASRASTRSSAGKSHTSAESDRPNRSVRSLVAGSKLAGASAASTSACQCGCSPTRQRSPRPVNTNPRPLRTNSGAPTVVVNRRSAALTAGCVKYRRFAASVTLPASATTANTRSRFRSRSLP